MIHGLGGYVLCWVLSSYCLLFIARADAGVCTSLVEVLSSLISSGSFPRSCHRRQTKSVSAVATLSFILYINVWYFLHMCKWFKCNKHLNLISYASTTVEKRCWGHSIIGSVHLGVDVWVCASWKPCEHDISMTAHQEMRYPNVTWHISQWQLIRRWDTQMWRDVSLNDSSSGDEIPKRDVTYLLSVYFFTTELRMTCPLQEHSSK